MRNFNVFDPSQWSDVHGFVILMLVMAGTVAGVVTKLIGSRWSDWLDEPRGRGSINDDWLLDGAAREHGARTGRTSKSPPKGDLGNNSLV